MQRSSGAKTEPTKARRTDEHARRQTGEAGSKVVAWARSDSAPKKWHSPWHKVRACLKCKSVDPLVWKCPRAATEKSKRLYEEMKAASKGEAAKKKTSPVNGCVSGSGEELRSVSCKIGGVHVEAVLDSGANQSVMCSRLVEKLGVAGIWMTSRALGKEVELANFQEGLRVHIGREVKVDLDFSTFEGKLLLKNVVCWVAAAPLAAGLGDILVSR